MNTDGFFSYQCIRFIFSMIELQIFSMIEPVLYRQVVFTLVMYVHFYVFAVPACMIVCVHLVSPEGLGLTT